MAETLVSSCQLGEEQRARAGVYGLIARMLSSFPDEDALKEMASFPGDDTPIGMAMGQLAALAATTTVDQAEREYNDLFIGVAEGELTPFASHYLTGFLNEKPLSEVRDDLSRLGIERVDEVKEPEDHIAFLFEVMVGLITGQFIEAGNVEEEQKFFEKHITPWASKFFADLEKAENAKLYAPVGTLGLAFLDIEEKGFRIAP